MFWREDVNHPWRYEGRSSDLAAAQRQLDREGRFIMASGKGQVDLRRQIFRVKPDGTSFVLRVQEVRPPSAPPSRPVKHTLEVPPAVLKRTLLEETTKLIKSGLSRKNGAPFPLAEARRLATDVVKGQRPPELFYSTGGSFNRIAATRALKGGVAGGLLLPLLEAHQQYRDGTYNPLRLGQTAVVGFVSTGSAVGAGQFAAATAMRQQALAQAFGHQQGLVHPKL